MPFKTCDIKTPEFAYELVSQWRNLRGWPKNYGGLISLAISDFDKKISKMSESELEKFNRDNIKQINKWQDDDLIDPNARGIPKLRGKEY